ncbi:MAG: trypsin-like peptidase domain-containing protein [Pirellulales bacterium]|nr:trypsin-like peptidase domain-containing protein [Pirellulales bacterium]
MPVTIFGGSAAVTILRTLVVGFLLGWMMGADRAARGQEQTATATVPADPAELKKVEARVQHALAKALPCVVAVEAARKSPPLPGSRREPFGSGVIISEDGLILSQFHVSHQHDGTDSFKSLPAGHALTVILFDGQRKRAKLLGADIVNDLSLLKLDDPGPYPFAAVDAQRRPKIGEEVLKLGHPEGYLKGRPPVARLGKVIFTRDRIFGTDCQVVGGDSGGPFFNLDGELVGIILSSAGGAGAVIQESAKIGRGGFFTAVTGNETIATDLPALLRGELLIPPSAEKNQASTTPVTAAHPEIVTLQGEYWTQGSKSLAAWQTVPQLSAVKVVTIRNGSQRVARGWLTPAGIVTKASNLPPQPTCEFADGVRLPATIIGADPATDLALLHIESSADKPAESESAAIPFTGTFVGAVGESSTPFAVGVVSVPTHDSQGPFPRALPPFRPAPAARPEIIGSAVQGRGYWVEFVDGLAAESGILPGDVLLKIGETMVRRHQDLAESVQGKLAGDTLPVRLLRNATPLTVNLTLPANRFYEPSGRRGEFPRVWETDIPLKNDELGCPIVDLAGQVAGIAIAQTSTGTAVIPVDAVNELLPKLSTKAFRVTVETVLPNRAASPAAKALPENNLTVAELTDLLRGRQAAIHSLQVEYDLTSEALVEPLTLMSWQWHHVRDYTEQHRIAYTDKNQMFVSVIRPPGQLAYAPADRVTPDPQAPPDVVDEIERARQAASFRKRRGDYDYFIAIRGGETIQRLFDGRDCYAWNEGRQLFAKTSRDNFYAPVMLLANLGLRPLDPQPDPNALTSQKSLLFPENLSQLTNVRMLPQQELVDDRACVVLIGERESDVAGKRVKITEKFWFDPQLNYAPRRWTQSINDTLASERINQDFEEFAPGVWLPWLASYNRACPDWAGEEYKNKIAVRYHMRLKRARVNDVPESLFKP